MVESINKSSNIINQPQISEVREKIIVEPKDSLNIQNPSSCNEQNIVKFSPEKIEEVKKHMEEEGFVFDQDGFASAIIYSAGIEHKLCDAEKAVLMMGGKFTGSLWLINAFKADITPSVYSYLKDNMTGYAPCPDRQFKSLIKPLLFCTPDE